MCGIAGFWSAATAAPQDFEGTIRAMTDALVHRGPDDSGVWIDEEAGLALGHRRLSILDLSPLGRQPMFSADGRYGIVFNGEVYNYVELRRELEPLGHAFKGGSDTEVMLAAFSQWGLRAAVERFIGMFAFALWDRTERVLHLVRDRLGIKPLYYGVTGGNLVFGSELKALRAHPAFDRPVDRGALALYFRYNYIPAPHSIYQGIRKLEPGAILSFRDPLAESREDVYWSAAEVWKHGAQNSLGGGDEREIEDRLEALIADAIRLRMIADVPLGAFLSGGIDSSTVVALMQVQSSRPVKTFSIGFGEKGFNEAPHAAAVARHLGTEHTELYLAPEDLLRAVPEIPRWWDEPFSDVSQIPTLLVSRLAREHVTVALSGDGGDELFAGYSRYKWIAGAARVLALPLWLRGAARVAGRLLPARPWPLLGSLPSKLRWRLDILGAESFAEFYEFFLSHHKRPEEFVLGGREPASRIDSRDEAGFTDRFQAMSSWDLVQYLPDDILAKVDRASMAVALEARVPLLDHRVVEFAAAVPTAMKVRGGVGKRILRRILHRHVPAELVERPKMGFGVPIEHWLGHELRDWCEDLLDPSRIRQQGFIDAAAVERMWREYLAGQVNWHYYLWDVLMFQAWLAEVRP